MEVIARLLGRPPRVTGEGKANNISDEPLDGEQHVDPGILGAVTRGEWIMVLEREAPQADLNTNSVFDACAVTLRTASRHAVTVWTLCSQAASAADEGTASVTFEVVDVRHPILSVAMLVANGHRVFFRKVS